MAKEIRKQDKKEQEYEEALAELQQREKQRDSKFQPIHDFDEKIRQQKGQS